MKRLQCQIIWAMVLTLCSAFTFALDLSTAKQKGWVGEQVNGYLGAPQGSVNGEVAALISDINAKRKQKYKEIAAKVGKPLATVEQLAGEKTIAKTVPGNYVQLPDGKWVKK